MAQRRPYCTIDEGEKAAALVEFAIVVSGLVLGTLLFIDIMIASIEYLRIAQAVGEGLKVASRLPGLEQNPSTEFGTADPFFVNLDQLPGASVCDAGSVPTFPCEQLLLHRRVRTLLARITQRVDLENTDIRSRYDPDGLNEDFNQAVRLEVSAAVNTFWLPSPPITVHLGGPYL